MSNLLTVIRADLLAARKDAINTTIQDVVTKKDLLLTFVAEIDYAIKSGETITDEFVVRKLKKYIENATSVYAVAMNNNDAINSDKASTELSVLSGYLPKQLSEDEIKTVITTCGVELVKANKGAVMGALRKSHAGMYDGKLAATIFDSLAV